MDSTIEKKMRKRMNMITQEKSRAFNAQFGPISLTKSFDEIKDEKEAALRGDDGKASEDERDDAYESSMKKDCINELRRRRIHEMTFNRPLSTRSTKKKHTFWNIEDHLPRPAVVLSTPYSEVENDPLESAPVNNEEGTARVLWTTETNEAENNTSIEVTDADYEQDEIMTPVRIKKSVFIEVDGEDPKQIVTEISTATQALSSFVTGAAAVIKEAKTPDTSKDQSEYEKNRLRFELGVNESEPVEEPTEQDNGCNRTAASAIKLFNDMTVTPFNKLISKVPTPLTSNTVESNSDGPELLVKKLGFGENAEDELVTTFEESSLWPSLFVDVDSEVQQSPSKPIGHANKAMLEALVQGGALQQEIDGKNVLKLFVDMYQKQTFKKIVSAIQELKGLQGLVICRAVDKDRSTYRTIQEIDSLFDATKSMQQLDSLTLLNFESSSMTSVARMIHDQPLLYRLQIQLTEGTLNGEILGVMATAPRLTHVSFDIKESCSLGTLINSKTLESVCVTSRNLALKKSHLRTLICSLQTNYTLTTLDLMPAISVEQFRDLCSALRQNFRLESLRLNVEWKTQDESDIVTAELVDLFRENTFLLNVWNYSYQWCDIGVANKEQILAALRNSKSMQEFRFFSEGVSEWMPTTAKKRSKGHLAWWKKQCCTPETHLADDLDLSLHSKTPTAVPESPADKDSSPYSFTDCSTFSPPFDCNNVAQMRAKFQSWANKHTTNVKDKRMEV